MKDRLFKILSNPFTEDIVFFLALWTFASLADFVAYCLYGMPIYAVYYALHGYVVVYLLLLIAGLIPGRGGKYLKIAFLFAGVINVVVDVVCQYDFHTKFNPDFVQIIKATTFRESTEFAQTFVGVIPVLLCAVVFSIAFIFYIFRKQIKNAAMQYSKSAIVFGYVLLAVISCASYFKRSTNWDGVFVNKIAMFFCDNSSVNLLDYRREIDLLYDRGTIPAKIVLIIGESHSRMHSSLYGYQKNTSPLIAQRADSGEIVIFREPVAPACHTQEVFKEIFNTYRYDLDSLGRQLKWYESPNIFDFARAVGKSSYWISNQDQRGVYDNIPYSWSQLCDSAYFAGSGFMVAGRIQQDGNYDESVVDLYYHNNLDEQHNGLFVFHLMGSHEAFNYRYPSSFAVFKATDYMDKPKNQREVIASYDNSILYNDYILDRIIDLFKEDDSIVFYFSDHALDIFNSSKTYYGHSRNDKESILAGESIPFWVYTSPQCRVLHQDVINRIMLIKDERMSTGMFFTSLLKVLDANILKDSNETTLHHPLPGESRRDGEGAGE